MTMVPSGSDQSGLMSFGQTELEPGSLVPPRVKIIQQMSAEATRDEEPAKLGDLYNTLTGENFGTKLEFIPLVPFQQRILLVRDERREGINLALGNSGFALLSEGTGLKCRSFDMYQGQGEPGLACNECPLRAWEGNNPPLCTETYNVASMTMLGELIILSFQKSSAKVGKRVFSMIRMRPQAPWTRVYEIRTSKVSNDKGTFAVPDVVVSQSQVPDELMSQAIAWARQLKGARIDVTPIDEEDEATGPEPDGEGLPF